MYRDNTLIPTEAIRLAALGQLAESDRPYSELAREVRQFVSLIVGPSLDMLGPSLALLCFEGLVASNGNISADPDAILSITKEGQAIFQTLMTSNVRAPVNDVSKLVVALKLRFLHLLNIEYRKAQIEMLSDMCKTELVRLEALRSSQVDGQFAEWLGFEITQLKARMSWLQGLN